MFGDDVIDDMCATPSDSDDDAEDCEHGTDAEATDLICMCSEICSFLAACDAGSVMP